jgi:hypothetical protein
MKIKERWLTSPSQQVIFDDCTIETYFTLKWIRLSPHWQTTLISTNSWNTIKNCEFKNHGINMCACDYNLADFYCTNFLSPKSVANGMNGLNNQRIFPTLCASAPSNNWNTFNFGNSINTIYFEGNVPSSPLEVKHTYLWDSIGGQLLLNLLPPKFKDPIVPNKVTDFYSCPQCSESTPAGTGTLANCDNFPRLKRETDLSDEIGLTVSPNPSTEFLLVENAGDKQNIKIINLVGKVEIQNELYYGVQKIDISKLPAGLYLLITENNQSYKFIKM